MTQTMDGRSVVAECMFAYRVSDCTAAAKAMVIKGGYATVSMETLAMTHAANVVTTTIRSLPYAPHGNADALCAAFEYAVSVGTRSICASPAVVEVQLWNVQLFGVVALAAARKASAPASASASASASTPSKKATPK
jgi:hypothetical protein